MHDWSKCFGRPVSGVEGVFALERAGWGDTHATNLVVVCRARVGGVLCDTFCEKTYKTEIRNFLALSMQCRGHLNFSGPFSFIYSVQRSEIENATFQKNTENYMYR